MPHLSRLNTPISSFVAGPLSWLAMAWLSACQPVAGGETGDPGVVDDQAGPTTGDGHCAPDSPPRTRAAPSASTRTSDSGIGRGQEVAQFARLGDGRVVVADRAFGLRVLEQDGTVLRNGPALDLPWTNGMVEPVALESLGGSRVLWVTEAGILLVDLAGPAPRLLQRQDWPASERTLVEAVAAKVVRDDEALALYAVADVMTLEGDCHRTQTKLFGLQVEDDALGRLSEPTLGPEAMVARFDDSSASLGQLVVAHRRQLEAADDSSGFATDLQLLSLPVDGIAQDHGRVGDIEGMLSEPGMLRVGPGHIDALAYLPGLSTREHPLSLLRFASSDPDAVTLTSQCGVPMRAIVPSVDLAYDRLPLAEDSFFLLDTSGDQGAAEPWLVAKDIGHASGRVVHGGSAIGPEPCAATELEMPAGAALGALSGGRFVIAGGSDAEHTAVAVYEPAAPSTPLAQVTVELESPSRLEILTSPAPEKGMTFAVRYLDQASNRPASALVSGSEAGLTWYPSDDLPESVVTGAIRFDNDLLLLHRFQLSRLSLDARGRPAQRSAGEIWPSATSALVFEDVVVELSRGVPSGDPGAASAPSHLSFVGSSLQPREVLARLPVGDAASIHAVNGLLVVLEPMADSTATRVFDVSDPSAPAELAKTVMPIPFDFRQSWSSGTKLILQRVRPVLPARSVSTFHVIDFTNPKAPTLKSHDGPAGKAALHAFLKDELIFYSYSAPDAPDSPVAPVFLQRIDVASGSVGSPVRVSGPILAAAGTDTVYAAHTESAGTGFRQRLERAVIRGEKVEVNARFESQGARFMDARLVDQYLLTTTDDGTFFVVSPDTLELLGSTPGRAYQIIGVHDQVAALDTPWEEVALVDFSDPGAPTARPEVRGTAEAITDRGVLYLREGYATHWLEF